MFAFCFTCFAYTLHFSLGQNSVTIKRVGHGWVRTYHIETRTTKEFIPLWNKHATMPLMRLVVCFDGRISHTVTVSSPSSSSALPVSPFHSPPFMPLTVCYFVLLHVLLLLFCFVLFIYYLFYFLPRSVSPLHSRLSPFPLCYLSFSPFPRFHLSLAQH